MARTEDTPGMEKQKANRFQTGNIAIKSFRIVELSSQSKTYAHPTVCLQANYNGTGG
jgi:hypothetical protein